MHMIVTAASESVSLEGMPTALGLPGNCIPCALWHLLPDRHDRIIKRLDEKTEANLVARRRRYRTACYAHAHNIANTF